MARCAFCSNPADYRYTYSAIAATVSGRGNGLQDFVKYACHEHTAAATAFAMCRSNTHKREPVEHEA